MINPFFKNKGPKKIEEILTQIKSQSISKYSGINITNLGIPMSYFFIYLAISSIFPSLQIKLVSVILQSTVYLYLECINAYLAVRTLISDYLRAKVS